MLYKCPLRTMPLGATGQSASYSLGSLKPCSLIASFKLLNDLLSTEEFPVNTFCLQNVERVSKAVLTPTFTGTSRVETKTLTLINDP